MLGNIARQPLNGTLKLLHKTGAVNRHESVRAAPYLYSCTISSQVAKYLIWHEFGKQGHLATTQAKTLFH
jgi:hypothetical protein